MRTATGNPLQIRNPPQNLVSNALKFGRDGAPLRVRVRVEGRRNGRWAYLTVIDTG